jgi:ribonuclease HII
MRTTPSSAQIIIGVDEAGRGPLAGPVVAGAVALFAGQIIEGVACSKTLSAKKREQLFPVIQESAMAWAIAECSAEEIDRYNILQASLLAMHRAVSQVVKSLGVTDQQVHVLVDGNRLPRWPYAATAIVKGDTKEPCISAASILAKVHRDALCQTMHQRFPMYGFDKHMGYPTAEHVAKLMEHGPCEQHRKSYAPVRASLARAELLIE